MYCKSLFTCETIVSQNFMRLMTCEENSFGENYELRIRIHMYCQTHADKGSCKIKVNHSTQKRPVLKNRTAV